MVIGDRVVVQVQPMLGRVGTLVEIEGESAAVQLDAGSIFRCRLADLIPLR